MGYILSKFNIAFLFCILFQTTTSFAQIIANSEYLPNTTIKDKDGNKGECDVWISKIGVNLPLIYKPATEERGIRLYGISLSAKHLQISGEEAPVNDVTACNFALTHFRTLSNKRWGLISCAGVGINKCQHLPIGSENLSAFALCRLDYRIRPKFPIGFGLAFTNNFDLPLVAPSFAISYKTESGNYGIEVASMAYDLKFRCYRKFGEHFKLALRTTYDRIGSPVVIENGKDQLFSYNYIFSGLSPEYCFNKKTSIGASLGYFLWSKMAFRERNLMSIFHSPEKEYQGEPSPFVSAYFVYTLF